MIELSDLRKMPPGCIFAEGQRLDSPDGLNMSGTGVTLLWVACRGVGMPDWAIYVIRHVGDVTDFDRIRASKFGDKVQDNDNIKRLINCSDEAMGYYRH